MARGLKLLEAFSVLFLKDFLIDDHQVAAVVLKIRNFCYLLSHAPFLDQNVHGNVYYYKDEGTEIMHNLGRGPSTLL
jgi:hypothetical protein